MKVLYISGPFSHPVCQAAVAQRLKDCKQQKVIDA